MNTLKALVVAALLSGLAIAMNLTAENLASETPMMVNTPIASL